MLVQGCGKQAAGTAVTFVGQFLIAVPVCIICAFPLHMGVAGLFVGLICGVTIQSGSYALLLLRMDWQKLARRAAASAELEGKDVQLGAPQESTTQT